MPGSIERLKKTVAIDLNLIEVDCAIQFGTFVSDIGNGDRCIPSDLALNAEVPLLDVGRAEVRVDRVAKTISSIKIIKVRPIS